MMRLVGGSGVTITPAEVIPALQRGVVDGAFTAAVPALDWKFNEVTKFGYMMNLTLAHQVVAVNQAALDKLPADLRATFLAKAKEWAPKLSRRADQGRYGSAQDPDRKRHDLARCDARRTREAARAHQADRGRMGRPSPAMSARRC